MARLHRSRTRTLGLLLSIAYLPLTLVGAQADEMDDVLGGFDDEEPEIFDADPSAMVGIEEDQRFWDLDGSYELSASINYLPHDSSSGSDYTGVMRLRNRLNLELDFELPRDWEARIAGYVFGDPIYAIRGRDDYTSQVLNDYQWEVDLGETYLQGSLLPNVDVKIGRQIVIWGRSDTIRVIDVLNPLDNREPGRIDIEDLRLATVMIRGDAYFGPWSVSAIAIPELRFNRNPPYGSDFYTAPAPILETSPRVSASNTEWAASVSGIFSGWDISFHAARIFDDTPYAVADASQPLGIYLEHARIWVGGASGNFTRGSWLFKGEFAYLSGLEFFSASDKSRVDVLLGVEYYGFSDTSLSLDIANRHIVDFEPGMALLPDFAQRDSQEIALRYTADWMADTLHTTALGLLLGWKAQNGAIVRLSVDYDLLDALVVGGGILFFFEGERPPLDAWGSNDRIFMRVKYSF
ncbi:hypothetical protein MK489_15700 [Myxococcota bacterium]|nr:hypothetical protein [Myxococcota bacterium]